MAEAGQSFVHEWHGQTVIHPIGLAAIIVLGIGMLLLPRRYALLPMIAMACFIAPAQRLVIAGLDFNLLRVLVLFAWARIILRNEGAGFVWKPLDTVLLLWAAVSVVTYTLLIGSTSAFVNRLGIAFDAVGMYFVFRCLLRTWDDVDRTILGFIVISIPVAFAFLVEWSTGRNGFAFFGGVPETTAVRAGRLRCQGAFAHPILAGCFWAAVMPMIAARWWKGGACRTWVAIGLAASGLIVFACSSSTPVMAVLLSLVGAGCFILRRHMSLVRWAILLMLVSLHMVMNRPVWHLICRINVVGGSAGWHRYQIIDQALKHLDEWWLLGTPSVAHWQVWAGDITNQYVVEGIMGGMAKLGLFVASIVLAFSGVGRLWRRHEKDPYRLALSWALGVALFVHCVNYIGVAYFGQIITVWYLQLAMIASLAPMVEFRPKPASQTWRPASVCRSYGARSCEV